MTIICYSDSIYVIDFVKIRNERNKVKEQEWWSRLDSTPLLPIINWYQLSISHCCLSYGYLSHEADMLHVTLNGNRYYFIDSVGIMQHKFINGDTWLEIHHTQSDCIRIFSIHGTMSAC